VSSEWLIGVVETKEYKLRTQERRPH